MNVFVALSIFLRSCVLVRSEDVILMRSKGQDSKEVHDDSVTSAVQSTFRHVVPLTSVTFPGNVIKSKYVKNWIVLYCASWFEPCAKLQPEFNDIASKMHHERNDKFDMLSSDVRFAQVDCAKEKPLCNAMNTMRVNTYPVVAHYRGGMQSVWVSGYERTKDHQEKVALADWVNSRLADTSDDTQDRSLLTVWQDLDEETRHLIGALACVCVMVFSLRQCMGQFSQLAKLRADGAEKTYTIGSDGHVVVLQAGAPIAEGAAPVAESMDLDALLVSPSPLAAAPLPSLQRALSCDATSSTCALHANFRSNNRCKMK